MYSCPIKVLGHNYANSKTNNKGHILTNIRVTQNIFSSVQIILIVNATKSLLICFFVVYAFQVSKIIK